MEDAYEQFRCRERRQEAWLRKRPICSYCGERIQDEKLFDIEGELYHEECLVQNFRKDTEDYIA